MTKKPKRPADMNKLAKSIVDIATGEESKPEPIKVPARKIGALARTKNLSEEERADIARTAAMARWKKD